MGLHVLNVIMPCEATIKKKLCKCVKTAIGVWLLIGGEHNLNWVNGNITLESLFCYVCIEKKIRELLLVFCFVKEMPEWKFFCKFWKVTAEMFLASISWVKLFSRKVVGSPVLRSEENEGLWREALQAGQNKLQGWGCIPLDWGVLKRWNLHALDLGPKYLPKIFS